MMRDVLDLREGILGLLYGADDEREESVNDALYDIEENVYFFKSSFDEEMYEWLSVVDEYLGDNFESSKLNLDFDEALDVVSRVLSGVLKSGVLDGVSSESGFNIVEAYGSELPVKFERFRGYMLANI